MSGPDKPEPAPTFATTKVPDGFTFSAIRPVQLSIAADPKLLPAGASASLEIARPDGALLYRGPLTSKAPLQLKVPLATKDSRLTARLKGAGPVQSITLEIAGDSAAHTFQ
jgi:hypothetical protein